MSPWQHHVPETQKLPHGHWRRDLNFSEGFQLCRGLVNLEHSLVTACSPETARSNIICRDLIFSEKNT